MYTRKTANCEQATMAVTWLATMQNAILHRCKTTQIALCPQVTISIIWHALLDKAQALHQDKLTSLHQFYKVFISLVFFFSFPFSSSQKKELAIYEWNQSILARGNKLFSLLCMIILRAHIPITELSSPPSGCPEDLGSDAYWKLVSHLFLS